MSAARGDEATAAIGGRLRLLITGFGPFPGAPVNPTEPLVARLTRLRRPALDAVERAGHIFPVTYQAVDAQLPRLLAAFQPHGLLMFGLAARTPWLRVETRARNAVTTLWPDAAQQRGRHAAIDGRAEARRFGPHTGKLLRAAAQTGIEARASRDAGRYLCNYLGWRALEAGSGAGGPLLSAFIHVPLLPRAGTAQRQGAAPPITLEQLVDAGEALLMEMVRLTRQARLARSGVETTCPPKLARAKAEAVTRRLPS